MRLESSSHTPPTFQNVPPPEPINEVLIIYS